MAEPNTSSNNASGAANVPGAGAPPNIQKLVASKRLQQAQAQVGEVVDIMRINVEKVLERDQKISDLDRRADDLQEGASQFQQQAVKLKRKYWWENVKMWIVIAVVLVVIIIVIVVSSTGTQSEPLPAANAGEVVNSGTGVDTHVGSEPPAVLGESAPAKT